MTTNIIDITDILLVDRKNLTENQQEVVKEVGMAQHSIKCAANWPEGRENYMRHCRSHLERALVYLNEELDGPQDES